GSEILLIDEVANHESLSTAEFLLDLGKKVHLITRLATLGANLFGTNDLPLYYQRLFPKGLTVTLMSRVKEISGATVTTVHVHSDKESVLENVDAIVLAAGKKAENRLCYDLKGRVPEL